MQQPAEKTDEMQGTECEGEGSVLRGHAHSLIAKGMQQFAVFHRSLVDLVKGNAEAFVLEKHPCKLVS